MSCLYCNRLPIAKGLCSRHYQRWQKKIPMEGPPPPKASFVDLSGQRFGRLLVSSRLSNNDKGYAYWLCKCDCGNEHKAMGIALRRGDIKSCGCYQTDQKRQLCLNRTRHGEARQGKATREYTTWSSMKRRCYNTSDKFYSYYGGRGIVVCERWLNNYENFLLDMGRRPSDNHSLDRIDPNGNYEPSNCQWATAEQQNQNKRVILYLKELNRAHKLLEAYRQKYGELDVR